MSSSSSDSDDLEPIRRIKINIKPKEVVKSNGADIAAIKASVEAWRPLGPRPHHSLTRRQSSLSSVSSLSFGTGSIQGGSGSTTATSSAGFNYSQHSGPTVAPARPSSNSISTTRGNNHNRYPNNNTENTFMRSSPSCSSLVNEFNNRTSFSNFMSNVSRTSSPLTFINNYGDTVPIALAIQESIELTVKGHKGPAKTGIKFDTRALGNIKVAFPHAYARSCSNGYKPSSVLKLRLHSTDSILRYYASGLIRDLDSGSNGNLTSSTSTNGLEDDSASANSNSPRDCNVDLFDMNESPTKTRGTTKVIEFDMDALMTQLKQQYDQSPNGRYYNVDGLRYQIAPIDRLEKCPIQVCAYWKVESRLIKLRIDFKHSGESGFNLERLREIVFSVDLSNLLPSNLHIKPVSSDAFATLKANKTNNNNLTTFRDLSVGARHDGAQLHEPQTTAAISMEHSNHQYRNLINVSDTPKQSPQLRMDSLKQPSSMQIRLPPPPSKGQSRGQHTLSRNNLTSSSSSSTGSTSSLRGQQYASFENQTAKNSYLDSDLLPMSNQTKTATQTGTTPTQNHDKINHTRDMVASSSSHRQEPLMSAINLTLISNTRTPDESVPSTQAQAPTGPYITYEPQAHWNQHTKQLTWKFDNLLSYYKTDGYGSLLAKLDFRDWAPASGSDELFVEQGGAPKPVDIKFMVVDATISKISLSVDSTGYRMSLLKKEVRSGRYKSEPYIS